MKKVLSVLSSGFVVIIFIGLMIALILIFKNATGKNETAITFQSPVKQQMPSPTNTPSLSFQRISPIATPTLFRMSAKATVAALGSQHKSEATPRPLTPIKSSQDIVDAVLNDTLFQKYLDDPMFGPNSKDAIPGKPVAVRLISKKYFGITYYIVPFYKDGYVTGLATVWIEDGMGGMGMWSNAYAKQFPFVDATEAVKRVAEMKHTVMGEPELVFMPTREGGGDWTNPFWEIKTKEGVIFYVMYVLNETEIYRADEVHPIG